MHCRWVPNPAPPLYVLVVYISPTHRTTSLLLCVTQQLRARDLEAALAVERSGQQEAQRSLDVLRSHLSELERVNSLERERRGRTERALQR